MVMSKKEFAMADDPDWFADNYEYQVVSGKYRYCLYLK
jgi:hypothetical protein